MARLMTTRHWGSDDSTESLTISYLDKKSPSKLQFTKVHGTRNEDESSSLSRGWGDRNNLDQSPSKVIKKQGLRNLRVLTATTLFNDRKNHSVDLTKVKPSALLYEITERTNQLAQPRTRIAHVLSETVTLIRKASQVPRPSQRIIELSRPRMIYQQPSKPVGYVAPSALTAIATQRIIELSKPRRKRKAKVSKRKRGNNFLHKDNLQSKVRRFSKLRRNGEQFLKTQKGRSWCNMRYKKKKLDREYDSYHRRSERRVKKKRPTRRKHPLRSSNSNRTVIMVDLNHKNDSQKKPKISH